MSCGDLFLYKGRPNRADRVCVSTCRGPRALTDRLEPPRWGEAWVPLVAAPWGSVQRPRRPPRGGNPTAADEPGRGGGGAGAHGGGARSPDRGVSRSARRGEAAPGEKRSKGCGSGEAVGRAPRGVGPRAAPSLLRARVGPGQWSPEEGAPLGKALGACAAPGPCTRLPCRAGCRPSPLRHLPLEPSGKPARPPPPLTTVGEPPALAAGGGGKGGSAQPREGGVQPWSPSALHPAPPRPSSPSELTWLLLCSWAARSGSCPSLRFLPPLLEKETSRMSGGGSVYTVAAQTVVTRRHSQAVSR